MKKRTKKRLFPGRVVVLQPRPGLGDLVWHLPVIRGVAKASQSGRVVLVTKRSTQADVLLAGDAAIERVVWLEHNARGGAAGRHDGASGFARLVADLRSCKAQTGVLLHHGASLAAAMRLAGIDARYGYGFTAAQRFWLNTPPYAPSPSPFTEASEQARVFAGSIGFGALPEPTVAVQHAAALRVSELMAAATRPWLALGIGSNGAVRQWGGARFAALARALLRLGQGQGQGQGPGTVVLLASSGERALAEGVARGIGCAERVRLAVGWDLAEVVAFLASADVFVGNDSGLLNVRAAVGRPGYGLFGASGPLLHSALIRAVVPAGGARAGMGAIGVDQVMKEVSGSF